VRWILCLALTGAASAQALRWDDLPAAIQRRLTAAGVEAQSFAVFRQDHERRTLERVREGDLDALVYYALQSTAFTKDPPIEPALSAKTFVDGLDRDTRERFLSGNVSPVDRVPVAARRRLTALVPALRNPPPGSRLAYFRDVVPRKTGPSTTLRTSAEVETFLLDQYARAMRFLYEKEFAARQRAASAEAIATLYRERGLSTDTAIEAGYLVHLGLATLRALEPTRRIRRVLIIGPGLDLAPRTGLLEAGPPESYQPYAVVDSLVALGLARLDDLVVIAADVNARVVDHLRGARNRNVSLMLMTGVGDSDTLTLQDDYRSYFNGLGGSIGDAIAAPALRDRYRGLPRASSRGHLRKSLRIRREASRVIDAVSLDVATQRIEGDPFDLVIATNVFPYLDDVPLVLALTNIAAMLAPGGVLLHNEARPLVGEVTGELDLPLTQARTATIASVRGSATPLFDRVFMHVKVASTPVGWTRYPSAASPTAP
jgi:SAM-dependent methyltransferase